LYATPLGRRGKAAAAVSVAAAMCAAIGLPMLAGSASADTVPMPVNATATVPAGQGIVSGNSISGLKAGSVITINVDASAAANGGVGSSIFGFDARICKPGSDLQFSADFNPTQTGNCALNPLAVGAHSIRTIATAPPNLVATQTFTVAPGADSFLDGGGNTINITCTAATNAAPCGLWLRMAVPGQSAFKHFDITFAGPASAPTGVAAVSGDTTTNLSWTAPSNSGDAPIDYYVVTPYIGGVAQPTIQTPTNANSFNVTGLTNFTAYTFDVAAHNTSGFLGTASAPAGPVTPTPPAPGGVTASAANAQATVAWSPVPGITPVRYRVTPTTGGVPGAPVFTANGSTTNLLFTGLLNGSAYTFTVAAEYAGPVFGPESASSPSVTPSNIFVTQTIIAARPQGALTLTEAGNTVTMPAAVLNGTGTFYNTSAALNQVTVTDTRDTNPGWNINAQVTDFTSGLNTFSGTNLGWVPVVTTAAPGQTVTAGGVVAPGTNPGLTATTPFASAPAGAGLGVSTLDATLNLQIPVAALAGTYTATMTITAI